MGELIDLNNYPLSLGENIEDSKTIIYMCYEGIRTGLKTYVPAPIDTLSLDSTKFYSTPTSEELREVFFDIVENNYITHISIGNSRIPAKQFILSIESFEFLLLESRSEFISSTGVLCNSSSNIILKEFNDVGRW